MTTLFRRDWKLVIGQFDVSELDIEFNVKKTIKPEPNVATVKIFNLSESIRQTLEQTSARGAKDQAGIPIRLEAGYKDARPQIYLGEVRNAQSTSQNADIITELTSGDGERAQQTSRIAVPVGPKSDPATVLRLVAQSLGVGDGNLASAMQLLLTKGQTTLHPKGTAFYGRSAQVLDDLCHAAGLEWSIQDGQLLILDKGKALEGSAVLLSPSTGLIGSPSIDNKGILSAKMLIQPDVRPGVKVKIDGHHAKGFFRVIETTFQGATLGNDWYIDLRGEAL